MWIAITIVAALCAPLILIWMRARKRWKESFPYIPLEHDPRLFRLAKERRAHADEARRHRLAASKAVSVVHRTQAMQMAWAEDAKAHNAKILYAEVQAMQAQERALRGDPFPPRA